MGFARGGGGVREILPDGGHLENGVVAGGRIGRVRGAAARGGDETSRRLCGHAHAQVRRLRVSHDAFVGAQAGGDGFFGAEVARFLADRAEPEDLRLGFRQRAERTSASSAAMKGGQRSLVSQAAAVERRPFSARRQNGSPWKPTTPDGVEGAIRRGSFSAVRRAPKVASRFGRPAFWPTGARRSPWRQTTVPASPTISGVRCARRRRRTARDSRWGSRRFGGGVGSGGNS
jgi:hypothetical protein